LATQALAQEEEEAERLPVEDAVLTFAPDVPRPIMRNHAVRLLVSMETTVADLPIDAANTYECWTFGGRVPGPFIRAREGDVLDVCFTNKDASGMPHNIDFHAITGPGGGASLLTAESMRTKRASFRLLAPGLFIYHCAVEPVGVHIANGMYGLVRLGRLPSLLLISPQMLVEPKEGLAPVNKEYYVLQSEFYTEKGSDPASRKLDFAFGAVLDERPTHVVFNGRAGALTGDNALKARVGDTVRIFFGNIGPALHSAFHVIGTTFDRVFRDADLLSPPARNLQTTSVPPGSATVVEFKIRVPGNYALVDHAILRVEKGCVGFVNAEGEPESPNIYYSDEAPANCQGCKIHP
jgi:copper-containing nitrite reductase